MAALTAPGWDEIESLIRLYRVGRPQPRGKPFEVLVHTILSQNTNDLNSGRAFGSLVAKVGVTPEALGNARVGEIGDAIRVGGLYNTKARRIKAIARGVMRRYPQGLDFLSGLDDQAVRSALGGFKGVGPKTVDIVLDFSLGRDVVPVDTHVNRVSKRMGYAPQKAGYQEVRSALEAVIPSGRRLEGHIALITHGRRICVARAPRCGLCPVSGTCAYFRARASKEAAT